MGKVGVYVPPKTATQTTTTMTAIIPPLLSENPPLLEPLAPASTSIPSALRVLLLEAVGMYTLSVRVACRTEVVDGSDCESAVGVGEGSWRCWCSASEGVLATSGMATVMVDPEGSSIVSVVVEGAAGPLSCAVVYGSCAARNASRAGKRVVDFILPFGFSRTWYTVRDYQRVEEQRIQKNTTETMRWTALFFTYLLPPIHAALKTTRTSRKTFEAPPCLSSTCARGARLRLRA